MVFEQPQDFVAKLAARVPAPRVHLTRFHGVLAPAAKWRPLIVPTPMVEADVASCDHATPPEPTGSLIFSSKLKLLIP